MSRFVIADFMAAIPPEVNRRLARLYMPNACLRTLKPFRKKGQLPAKRRTVKKPWHA